MVNRVLLSVILAFLFAAPAHLVLGEGLILRAYVGISNPPEPGASAIVTVFLINQSDEDIRVALGRNWQMRKFFSSRPHIKSRFDEWFSYYHHLQYYKCDPYDLDMGNAIKLGEGQLNAAVLGKGEAAELAGIHIDDWYAIKSLLISYKVTSDFGKLHNVWSGRVEFKLEGWELPDNKDGE